MLHIYSHLFVYGVCVCVRVCDSVQMRSKHVSGCHARLVLPQYLPCKAARANIEKQQQPARVI